MTQDIEFFYLLWFSFSFISLRQVENIIMVDYNYENSDFGCSTFGFSNGKFYYIENIED